jgi:hypothetical protein
MMITEAKLTELTGYTKNQIKHRRLHNWEVGIHYFMEPAKTYVYDPAAIELWQKQGQQSAISQTSSTNSDQQTSSSPTRLE